MRKKRSSAVPTLIMAVFALVIILFLMQQMRKNLTMSAATAPGEPIIGLIDSVYYHAPFRFSQQLPNEKWGCERLADTLDVVAADTTDALWPQIQWLVRFDRAEAYTLAEIRIGLLEWPGPVSHDDLAIELLAETMRKVETPGHRIAILQPVTSPAHHAFPGSYFVIIIPPRGIEQSTTLFCCVLSRRNWAYIILSESSESNYDLLRNELQEFIRGFQSYAVTR